MENKRGNPAYFISVAARMFRESMFEFASVFDVFDLVTTVSSFVFLFGLVLCFVYIYICIYIDLSMFIWSVCMSVNCSLPQAVANECLLVRTGGARGIWHDPTPDHPHV